MRIHRKSMRNVIALFLFCNKIDGEILDTIAFSFAFASAFVLVFRQSLAETNEGN